MFWQQMCQSYIKNFGIMNCPSGDPATKNTPLFGHYGSNRYLLRRRAPAEGAATKDSVSLAAVVAPASTYMIFDSGTYSLDAFNDGMSIPTQKQRGAFWYTPGTGKVTGKAPAAPALSDAFLQQDYQNGRHFGGMNIAFADGHVKYVKAETVVQQENLCTANLCAGSQPNAWDPGNPVQ
jgi:prepilin-type processing-associated H-X9-DG protein